MELHGLLNACDALFASFPRTLEKGPWEGQLIPQEIGTVWARLGLGEAWWNGETIVWGLWPRWIGTVLDVWDLLLFFSDLVLLGADAFSIFFPSRYIPFIPVPLFSHPFPSFSHPCPSPIFRWLAGSATGKVAGPARKWWVAGWFAVFFSKTPGGHRVDTMPYEWTRLPHTNPYKWNPSTVLKWAPMLVYADSFCRLGTGLPHEPIWIIWIHLDSFGFIWTMMNPYESIWIHLFFAYIYYIYIYLYLWIDRSIYLFVEQLQDLQRKLHRRRSRSTVDFGSAASPALENEWS